MNFVADRAARRELETMTLNAVQESLAAPAAAQSRNWLSVLSHIDPKYGGLSAVVPQMCEAVAAGGSVRVDIAAFCAADEAIDGRNGEAADIECWPMSRLRWARDKKLRSEFARRVEFAAGVHIHGLWEQSSDIAAKTSRRLGKPYILSAHGMLDTWALSHKKLKKQIYSTLIERANVNGAACLHALTRTEAEDYRRYGSRRPVAIIPNGVVIPARITPHAFWALYPELRAKRLLLFLGRLHFKKGLDLLVRSWASIAAQWPEAHLVLAGPDCEGTREKLELLIQQCGLNSRVTFPGMLRNGFKWSALAASECFILPSYSEGLSVATLEAMGAGLPVIVTQQCNLPQVRERRAGWVINPKESELTEALTECLAGGAQRNRAIGRRGVQLVREQHSWPVVGAQMNELYAWVAGGPLPSSFELWTESGERA